MPPDHQRTGLTPGGRTGMMQGDLTRSHTMLLLCPMSMLCGLEKLLLM